MPTRKPREPGIPRAALHTVLLAVSLSACSDAASGFATGSVATVVESGASHPTVAVSSATGRAYVAWIGSSNGAYDVYLSVAEPGASEFSEPVRVNDIPGDAAPHEQAPPQVALGPNDEVYVVWQNNTVIEGRRFPASDLRMAVSKDGGHEFAPAVTVNDDAGDLPSSHTFHNATIAANGTVLVSWIDGREQDRLREENADLTEEEISALAGPQIRVAGSTDAGSSFSPSLVVDEPSCPCCRTSIATGADGAIHVAWRKHFDGEIRDIVVATASGDGRSFGRPVRVHADAWEFPGCPHAGPAIAVGTDGTVHVAWYTGKEGRQGLWYAASEDAGATFGPPFPVVTAAWVPPSLVSLAPVGNDVLVAWENRTEATGTVEVGVVRESGRRLVGIASAVGRGPAIAAGAAAALVAWLDGDAIRARWLDLPDTAD